MEQVLLSKILRESEITSKTVLVDSWQVLTSFAYHYDVTSRLLT